MKTGVIIGIVISIIVLIAIMVTVIVIIKRRYNYEEEDIIDLIEEEGVLPYQPPLNESIPAPYYPTDGDQEETIPEPAPEPAPEPTVSQENFKWNIKENYNPMKGLTEDEDYDHIGDFNSLEGCRKACEELGESCSAFLWGHEDSPVKAKSCYARGRLPHVWKPENNQNYEVTGGLKMYKKPSSYSWDIQKGMNSLKGVKSNNRLRLGKFENVEQCKYACELNPECAAFRYVHKNSNKGTPKICLGRDDTTNIWEENNRSQYKITSGRKV